MKEGCYLELLAVDEANQAIKAPRWMGIDVLTHPQLTRWAIKSDNLAKDSAILKRYRSEMGHIQSGSRNTADGSRLKWELIMPLPVPEVELIPFMVDWSASEIHPSEYLPDMNCRLLTLYGTHPEPDSYTDVCNELGIAFKVTKSKQTL